VLSCARGAIVMLTICQQMQKAVTPLQHGEPIRMELTLQIQALLKSIPHVSHQLATASQSSH